MHGTYPVGHWFWLYCWLIGIGQFGPLGFGLYQVNHCQQLIRVDYLAHVRAYLISKHCQYAYHLTSFLSLQLAHLIVGLYHLSGFYKHSLTCGTLVVHYTVYPALQLWLHRYHQSSVAHGRGGILVHQSVALGGMQYSI